MAAAKYATEAGEAAVHAASISTPGASYQRVTDKRVWLPAGHWNTKLHNISAGGVLIQLPEGHRAHRYPPFSMVHALSSGLLYRGLLWSNSTRSYSPASL